MLRACSARLFEIALRFARLFKNSNVALQRAKENAKGIATRTSDDDRPARPGVTRMGEDTARGCVAIGDSTGRPDYGRAPLPYAAC